MKSKNKKLLETKKKGKVETKSEETFTKCAKVDHLKERLVQNMLAPLAQQTVSVSML